MRNTTRKPFWKLKAEKKLIPPGRTSAVFYTISELNRLMGKCPLRNLEACLLFMQLFHVYPVSFHFSYEDDGLVHAPDVADEINYLLEKRYIKVKEDEDGEKLLVPVPQWDRTLRENLNVLRFERDWRYAGTVKTVISFFSLFPTKDELVEGIKSCFEQIAADTDGRVVIKPGRKFYFMNYLSERSTGQKAVQ